jgi:hypothetical protein
MRSLDLSVPLSASPATAHYPTPTGRWEAGEIWMPPTPAGPTVSALGRGRKPCMTTNIADRAPTRRLPTGAERFRKYLVLRF